MTPAAYPRVWESDVVLDDGRTAHVRPIRPDDAQRLVAFHARLSPEARYYRFFSAKPRLTDTEVQHFTVVDYVHRFALVFTVDDDSLLRNQDTIMGIRGRVSRNCRAVRRAVAVLHGETSRCDW